MAKIENTTKKVVRITIKNKQRELAEIDVGMSGQRSVSSHGCKQLVRGEGQRLKTTARS